MKAASEELVALLAGSRQVVMWETFTFTLADGSQVAYSTKDPDAPTLASSGGGATWLLDTFTDTNGTLLSDHVGEIGATWSGDAANFDIQDNAAQSTVPFTVYARASGTPVAGTANYACRADGNTAQAGTSSPRVFGLAAGDLDFNGWETFLYAYAPDSPTLLLFAFIFGPSGETDLGPVDTGLPADEPHSLEARISDGRTVLTVLVDGVIYLTGSLPDSSQFATPDRVELRIDKDISGSPSVTEVEGTQ